MSSLLDRTSFSGVIVYSFAVVNDRIKAFDLLWKRRQGWPFRLMRVGVISSSSEFISYIFRG